MIVWLTGASSGIGREAAAEYVRQGHTVYASARSEDKLVALERECGGFSGKLKVLAVDVTYGGAMKRAFDTIVAVEEKLDLAIFNAGTHRETSAIDFSVEAHRRLMETNYIGVLNGLEAVLPDFIGRGSGQIAVVASVAGYRGLPKASAYGASKAALINLCESMREELKVEGVDLRLVNPGFVKTPLTDLNDFSMPFLMPVDRAVKAMIKGLAGKAFEITFPTPFALIMKTMRILPYWLYFKITKSII